MASPSKWKYWLLAFLLLELPAAIDGKRGGTLSELVWSILDRPWRRWAFFIFLQCLAFHLAFGTPSGLWIFASGLPVAWILFRGIKK